jgi:hypothetical protein
VPPIQKSFCRSPPLQINHIKIQWLFIQRRIGS